MASYRCVHTATILGNVFFFQFFLVMFVNDVVGRGNPLPVRLLTVRDARSVDFVFQTKKNRFFEVRQSST